MYVRYTIPDANGETREERNERFESSEITPDWEIPDAGFEYWGWYFEISHANNRIADGLVLRLPWSEMTAWAEAKGEIVTPAEYGILRQMDLAYCDEMSSELEYSRAIIEQQRERDAKRGKGKG